MWHAWRTDWGERSSHIRLEWPLLGRVFSYFVSYWKHSLVVLVCIGSAAVLDLVPAWATPLLIDRALRPGASFSYLLTLVAAMVGGVVAAGLVRVGQSYVSNLISQGIMHDLRNQMFRRLLAQSVAFFTGTRTGDVMSRLSNDVNGVQSVVSDTIFSLVSNVVILASTVALMLVFDWRLTLAALIVLPAFLLPTARVARATFDARRRTQSKLAELTGYLQEVLGISGILLVKAFVAEAAESRRFSALNRELRDLNIRQTMIGRWFFMLIGVLSSAGPAALWLAGGYLVLSGQAQVGVVVAFATVLLPRLYGPAGQLANTHVNVVGSLALFQRLFEYLDLESEIVEAPGAVTIPPAGGAIRFENVTFSYGPRARPALDEVSFSVEPGQLVALVGRSGAGKTTATSLVPRFHDPQRGRILIDGYDVRDLTLESLGRQIGMVFQDTFLFHSTIHENLLYGRPEATWEEVMWAARAAHIHDFIESLPDGYRTVVGERGHRLSGGEKQRLAIARVILKDPRILILDEATSNLDSESERLIQAALRPLFKGRTSLVIAHRLSTILAADQILVFDRGRLMERGTHFELLAHEGAYARLHSQQFGAEVAAT